MKFILASYAGTNFTKPRTKTSANLCTVHYPSYCGYRLEDISECLSISLPGSSSPLVPRPLSSIVIINQPSWRQFTAVTQTSSARKHALRCVKLWECGRKGGGWWIRQFTQLEAVLFAGRMEKCNQEMSTEAEPTDTHDARWLEEIVIRRRHYFRYL